MTKTQKVLLVVGFAVAGLFVGLVCGHFSAWDHRGSMWMDVVLAVLFAAEGAFGIPIMTQHLRLTRRFAIATYANGILAIIVGFVMMVKFLAV